MLHPLSLIFFAITSVATHSNSNHATAARPLPKASLSYSVTVDPARQDQFDVIMRASGQKTPLTLVMARHPEYDNRFWRYISDIRATSGGRALTVVREDSARWRVTDPAAGSASIADIQIAYRITLPPVVPGIRPSWKPFLRSNGAFIGGADFFLVPRGHSTSIDVHIDAPRTWKIATSLTPRTVSANNRDFTASDFFTLVDSPILLGALRTWDFTSGGIPHRIAYAPLPDAVPFDTLAYVNAIRRTTDEAVRMFRGAPYRNFVFLIQDGAYGGLEHASSVILGSPSATLARDLTEDAMDFAHEFFHSWNLVAIHPVGRGGVSEDAPPQARGLWLSEGFTIFYAEALLRRAGVLTTPRTDELARLIGMYVNNPGNAHVAPETTSRLTDLPPGAHGDYNPDLHLQGNMIAQVLDLTIRDSTRWTKSLDDVMRHLYVNRKRNGFTSRDVITAVNTVCSCSTDAFFARHVSGAAPVDFTAALPTIGLRTVMTPDTARGPGDRPQADMGLWAYEPEPGAPGRLILSDPQSLWARAGFHTNDEIVSWNGKRVTAFAEVRRSLRTLGVGDTLALTVTRSGAVHSATVIVPPQLETRVRIEPIPGATPQQRAHLATWMAAREH